MKEENMLYFCDWDSQTVVMQFKRKSLILDSMCY
jgi:hypothetical protein